MSDWLDKYPYTKKAVDDLRIDMAKATSEIVRILKPPFSELARYVTTIWEKIHKD